MKQRSQAYTVEDQRRREAWGRYFDHRDRIICFAHPFASTAHKAQGGTYREVYVDVGSMLAYENGRNALYVAATRPSEKLIYGGSNVPLPGCPLLE